MIIRRMYGVVLRPDSTDTCLMDRGGSWLAPHADTIVFPGVDWGRQGYHVYDYIPTVTRLRPQETHAFLVLPPCLLRPPMTGPEDNSVNDTGTHPGMTAVRLSGGSIIGIAGPIRFDCKLQCEEMTSANDYLVILFDGLHRVGVIKMMWVLLCRGMWGRC